MWDISKPIRELGQRFKRSFATLPPVIGNEVVNFSKDNFRMRGFTDTSFDPWKPRISKKDITRALLVKTGRLERSIHVIKYDAQQVVVGSSAEVPYARAHNEGASGPVTQNVKSYTRKTVKGVQTVKAFSRTINQNIPARPFLAKSVRLTGRLRRVAISHFIKHF